MLFPIGFEIKMQLFGGKPPAAHKGGDDLSEDTALHLPDDCGNEHDDDDGLPANSHPPYSHRWECVMKIRGGNVI